MSDRLQSVSHVEASEQLEALALGALSPEERETVLEHVRGCDECTAELQSLGDTAALLAKAVPSSTLDDVTRRRMRSRLMARAGAAGGDARATAPRRVAGQARGAWWLAAASLLIAAVAGVGWYSASREHAGDAARLAAMSRESVALASRSEAAERDLAQRDSLLAGLSGPVVKIMELTSGGKRAPGARMFWDVKHNRWTMFAHDIPQLASGRTYQLWFVMNDGAKISAGTFAPTHEGTVVMQATFKLPSASLRTLAVTDEPEGGVTQPTGPVVLQVASR